MELQDKHRNSINQSIISVQVAGTLFWTFLLPIKVFMRYYFDEKICLEVFSIEKNK